MGESMRFTGVLAGVLLFAVMAPWIQPARSTGPTIIDFWWEPMYPQHPSNFTLNVRVASPAPLASVWGSYCQISTTGGVGSCFLKTMTYDPGEDVWHAMAETWGEGTAYPEINGAAFQANARDENAQLASSEKKYIQFCTSIDLQAGLSSQTVLPGESLTACTEVLHGIVLSRG